MMLVFPTFSILTLVIVSALHAPSHFALPLLTIRVAQHAFGRFGEAVGKSARRQPQCRARQVGPAQVLQGLVEGMEGMEATRQQCGTKNGTGSVRPPCRRRSDNPMEACL